MYYFHVRSFIRLHTYGMQKNGGIVFSTNLPSLRDEWSIADYEYFDLLPNTNGFSPKIKAIKQRCIRLKY